ncbi:hypothetical protein [Acinetobacter indicus]|uniref:hypothetical protein n=1 Tax=Acinetobacter indicus TaxID=756892 RepID=UPI0025764F2D|nr:hypothetical protein [Acinetobacter indicus]MDM1286050.1 hypothetical protein [Acinetobacter indicus]
MAQDFISYLNTLHNLTPAGANALAESQVNNCYFNDIYSEFPIVSHIEKLIKTSENNVIIITGHAGDGKSTIAFDLIKRLDTNFANHAFKQHEYTSSYDLHILKDMSELSLSDRKEWLSQAFNNKGNWLIVSNTGPLLTSITEYLHSIDSTKNIESEIYNMLDRDISISDKLESLEDLNINLNISNKNLYIINIAKLDNIEVALNIFKKIIQHKSWNSLIENYPNHPIILNYCALKSSLNKVIESIRLVYLYLLSYEKRLTLRQMLAHFSAAITGGYQLDDNINTPLIFSDLFFGMIANKKWEKASKLTAISLLSSLNLSGYRSLELEKLITNSSTFSNTSPSIKTLADACIKDDIESYRHGIKTTLRRLTFMYDLYPETYVNAKALFLNSPFIIKFSEWRLDPENFTKIDAKNIKKMSLQALNLFFNGFSEEKNLNITLKRSDNSFFQIAQIKICSFQERDFEVRYCTNKQQPYLTLKGKSNIKLELSLPLLDYIQNITKGDITESISPIYKTQLERFKLLLIEYSESEIENEENIMLLHTLANGEVEETTIKFEKNFENEVTLSLED